MKKSFCISLIGLCSIACVFGSNPWDLEECINYAMNNNLQIRQLELDINLRELNVEQSKTNYIPTLGASAGYNANFGRALDPTTYQFVDNKTVNNFNAGIQLSSEIFAGMSKSHTLKQSKINLLGSLEGLEKAKNDIILSISAAYLQILYNKEQIQNSVNQVALLNEQIARTSKLVAAGSVTKGVLLDLQSQKATEEYNTVSYRNQHRISILNLAQLLDIRDEEYFDIKVPNVSSIVDTEPTGYVYDIFEKALDLPEIRQADYATQAAKSSISLARAKLYPTLSFSASYGSSFSDARQRPMLDQTGQPYYDKYPFVNQMGDNASGGIGVSLNIPIFYGLSAQRGVKTAKIQYLQSEISLVQAKNQLYKEISQALADATSAFDRYRSAKASVVAAEESFRYAESKFSQGATNVVDYNMAKNNLITQTSMMVQAKWEYVFKVKILDFYSGKPITL